MALTLYDTRSKAVKEFLPLQDKRVNFFVCGPTVYDYAHIGHARTYIAFDAFIKYLRHLEYEVRYVQNITDLDDKIIARANELHQTPQELARNFETEYYHDMEKLDIDSVDKYARATDYIPQIVSQVERLITNGYAYIIAGDGVYYDISKFENYGKLSGRTAVAAEDAVSRIDDSLNKRNKGDFALWKFSKSGEPSWDSSWGKGRPGWHIEDTAISEAELGQQYDIHGGARDLIFPHHESEIAQMEAISGKEPLVNFWMHTGFLTINGEKMSKSLGNFVTIHEFLQKYSKETFRLFILSSHYRSPIDYSEAAVKQAEVNVKRLGEFCTKISALARVEQNASSANPLPHLATRGIADFFSNLNDDFNTPKALAALFDLMRAGNALLAKNKITAVAASEIVKFLNDVDKIFGIIPAMRGEIIPEEIVVLAAKREQMRREENWEEADIIRRKIESMGYKIDDTDRGPEIKTLT